MQADSRPALAALCLRNWAIVSLARGGTPSMAKTTLFFTLNRLKVPRIIHHNARNTRLSAALQLVGAPVDPAAALPFSVKVDGDVRAACRRQAAARTRMSDSSKSSRSSSSKSSGSWDGKNERVWGLKREAREKRNKRRKSLLLPDGAAGLNRRGDGLLQ